MSGSDGGHLFQRLSRTGQSGRNGVIARLQSGEECFLPGTLLFEEGQAADEFFVLVEGNVEESFSAGEAVLSSISPLEPGELIGYPALAPPYVQNCTARSIDGTEVLAIDADGLRQLFARDCQLAVAIQRYVIGSLLERIGQLRLAGTEYA